MDGGLSVLSHNDMIIHAAAHLFADGDLSGGLRNLWDIHALVVEGGAEDWRPGRRIMVWRRPSVVQCV